MLSTAMVLAASMALGQADQVSAHYEHLKALEVFVGDWQFTFTQKGVDIFKGTVSYKWVKNKVFLQATACDEKGDHVATEMYGWDAAAKKMRLWTFKPDGGRNEAVISVEGDIFSGDYDMMQPDGTTKKAVVKGKFSGKEFNVAVRYVGAPDDEFKGTYRRK
jgi:hypothetical protein